jgi:hypothetical protein
MSEIINKIVEDYQSGARTLEETNAALKDAGAAFRIDPGKNPAGGWTEAETASGFFSGAPSAPKPAGPDMNRNTALAGWTVIQETVNGSYAVTYDADGYAVKAVKQ